MIEQCRNRIPASVCSVGGHFEYLLLRRLVDTVVRRLKTINIIEVFHKFPVLSKLLLSIVENDFCASQAVLLKFAKEVELLTTLRSQVP